MRGGRGEPAARRGRKQQRGQRAGEAPSYTPATSRRGHHHRLRRHVPSIG
jgi:hypothetical protein